MIEVSIGAKEAPKRNEYVLFYTFFSLINVSDFFLLIFTGSQLHPL